MSDVLTICERCAHVRLCHWVRGWWLCVLCHDAVSGGI
jgi:hypothetical protein